MLTAAITIHNINKNEYSQEISNMFDSIPDDQREPGFNQNMADVKIGHNFIEEKLKTRMHYWSSSDPKAMDSDKSCIICNKQKMNLDRRLVGSLCRKKTDQSVFFQYNRVSDQSV